MKREKKRKEKQKRNQPLGRQPARALAVARVPPDAVLAALVVGAVALAVWFVLWGREEEEGRRGKKGGEVREEVAGFFCSSSTTLRFPLGSIFIVRHACAPASLLAVRLHLSVEY